MLSPSRRPSASSSGPPDEPGASGAVCSRLPPILPAARAPEGALDGADRAERHPSAAAGGGGPGEDDRPGGGPVAIGPGDGLCAGRVDRDDREVAVHVDTGEAACRRSAVGERHGDLVAADVVGVGEDLAIGDDDTGAAQAGSDADDRRRDRAGECGQ